MKTIQPTLIGVPQGGKRYESPKWIARWVKETSTMLGGAGNVMTLVFKLLASDGTEKGAVLPVHPLAGETVCLIENDTYTYYRLASDVGDGNPTLGGVRSMPDDAERLPDGTVMAIGNKLYAQLPRAEAPEVDELYSAAIPTVEYIYRGQQNSSVELYYAGGSNQVSNKTIPAGTVVGMAYNGIVYFRVLAEPLTIGLMGVMLRDTDVFVADFLDNNLEPYPTGQVYNLGGGIYTAGAPTVMPILPDYRMEAPDRVSLLSTTMERNKTIAIESTIFEDWGDGPEEVDQKLEVWQLIHNASKSTITTLAAKPGVNSGQVVKGIYCERLPVGTPFVTIDGKKHYQPLPGAHVGKKYQLSQLTASAIYLGGTAANDLKGGDVLRIMGLKVTTDAGDEEDFACRVGLKQGDGSFLCGCLNDTQDATTVSTTNASRYKAELICHEY